MSNHAGNRPTDGRMLGRKGGSTLEKMSLAAAGEWALPPEGVLKDFGVQERVDAGFSTEKSGFALLVVVRNVSPQEHSRA